MKIIDEMRYDLDFNEPKVTVSRQLAIMENVKTIVMISESSLTVECGNSFVTVTGSDFNIKEIFEGRLLVEGVIQGVEFFRSPDSNKDRRF